MKRVLDATSVDSVIDPSRLIPWVAGACRELVKAPVRRQGWVSGAEQRPERRVSRHRPACRRGMKPEQGKAREVVGRGEQGEVRVDAHDAADARGVPRDGVA